MLSSEGHAIAAVVVWSPSRVQPFVTPWTAALQASLSLTISWSLPKFMFIASVMLSSHRILWRPLLVLPSIFPSIRVFSKESSVHIRWPKYYSIRPSSEYSGLISLKIDWFDLRDFQEFPPALQFEVINFWHSAFFTALTTIRDHWKDLDYTDLCRQSNVSAFQHAV